MYQPEATYRIQFNKDFKFSHLKQIIPYLHRLGIKTIYASPIFSAVPGSVHSYDGIDPNSINPEIGTLEELKELSRELKKRGMGWLQDFVPNHMAFTPQNAWLCDFLEKGKMSDYDDYFDKNADEPLMAPFLGSTLEGAIQNRELNLVYNKGKLWMRYYDTDYPLNYTTYYDILSHELFEALPFAVIKNKLDLLSQQTLKKEFGKQWKSLLHTLKEILSDKNTLRSFDNGLKKVSQDPAFMLHLNDQQFYRLCCWKETNRRINYRRFFTINGLIGVNMHRPEVFADYHRLLLQLVRKDIIQGIRIDHIDGLYHPAAYLDQLRAQVGPQVYIVVEKILRKEERLPAQWPVQGTTGYDFLAGVNQVLTGVSGSDAIHTFYKKILPDEDDPGQQQYRYKRMILQLYMQGELNNLLRTFYAIPGINVPPGIKANDIKALLSEMLVYCPVYRFYSSRIPMNEEEINEITALLNVVKKESDTPDEAIAFFRDCFTATTAKELPYTEGLAHFWKRCMQLTGPLMAKGIEDTFFYNFPRFLAHNEVGDDPVETGETIAAFHQRMLERQNFFPLAMNATATHDTKRGEDTRARLQLLNFNTETWVRLAQAYMEDDPGMDFHYKDRYFVLQTVYGSLPFKHDAPDWRQRLYAYLLKAAREGKVQSTWDEPDTQYENVLTHYAANITDPENLNGKGLQRFWKAQEAGTAINSLAQLTLKCTCPGIPDIYQGTEYWDLSFVDPDNRRPVDYTTRIKALQRIMDPGFDFNALLENITDPDIKLYTLYCLLQLRKTNASLFSKGSYEPVDLGPAFISFIRRYGEHAIWVVVPVGGSIENTVTNLSPLPANLPDQWQNIFTGEIQKNATLEITVSLKQFPVLVFKSASAGASRTAGLLLPLFSLPSGHGIGDMGSEARAFISFLSEGGQKIWQLLPLNPLLKANFFSPYASTSSFAGEQLFIDAEQLADEGWLTAQQLRDTEVQANATLDYALARELKMPLLHQAWKKFRKDKTHKWQLEFHVYTEKEKHWLDDYALFAVLKREFKEHPWYEWPSEFREREIKAINNIRSALKDQINYEKWLQFLFYRQWQALRKFAAQRNVKLIGDLPFYVSYDSVDVWVNREFFSVDKKGKMLYSAGVPPDYFSEQGQLWGMPTYNWEAMWQDGYTWWLNRLKRNVDLYDYVRIDHFRAFFDYWEVPAKATTAVNGAWKKGPQDQLFDLLREHFPQMPFIAEDLGELHQEVFDFKDRFRLPGMRVLQFGFSNYNAVLRDLPHNFNIESVVYTGTHDNNTILGWYRSLNENDKRAINTYLGAPVTEESIANVMCRLAYSSVCSMAILPVQDILGLDDHARINTPSVAKGNWQWRLLPGQLTKAASQKLLSWGKIYNR